MQECVLAQTGRNCASIMHLISLTSSLAADGEQLYSMALLAAAWEHPSCLTTIRQTGGDAASQQTALVQRLGADPRGMQMRVTLTSAWTVE